MQRARPSGRFESRARRALWSLRATGRDILCSVLLLGWALPGWADAAAAQLKQPTIDAFNHYVALTEARIKSEVSDRRTFLSVDQLPPQERQEALTRLNQGDVVVQKMETLDNGRPIPIPHGMVHHWLATVFIPGVDLAEMLSQQQNYDRSPSVYGPDIERCKLLRVEGDNFQVYYRLHRKVLMVSATFDADFHIRFVPVDEVREYSFSHSTKIAEVIDAGTPDETEEPVGMDSGYLWRLYTYTRYEQRDGGVYMQTEFLALSRSVPALFAWLIDPFVRSIPEDYLTHVLTATRTDLMNSRETSVRKGLDALPGRQAEPHVPVSAGTQVNVKGY